MIKLEVGKFYSLDDKKLFCAQLRYSKELGDNYYVLEKCGTPEVFNIGEKSPNLSGFKEWQEPDAEYRTTDVESEKPLRQRVKELEEQVDMIMSFLAI